MVAASLLFLVIDGVFVNGCGPFRFLVDTGAQSSTVTAEVARAAGLRPAYRVEQVTASGSRLTPAAIGVTLAFQGAAIPDLEVLINDVPLLRVDGILGQNYLASFNYLLDFRRGSLVLNAPEPEHRARIPFTRHRNRMVIEALLDGAPHSLVLDSGASAAVIPGVGSPGHAALLTTAAGSTSATLRERTLTLGPIRKRIPVAEVRTMPGGGPGLLPCDVLGVAYVNNERSYIVLP